MIRRSSRGLTLVELLVLIFILGMLLALLLPSLMQPKKSSQRAECVNKQVQLSKALLEYEMAHRHLPGYVNHFEDQWEGDKLVKAGARNLSWTVMCMPYLGREDLWKEWKSGGNRGRVRLDQLICPSDSPDDRPATSYVANCGMPGPDPSPAAACGVFHDHTVPPSSRTLVDCVSIPDGAAHTLLLTENIQAGWWTDTEEASIGFVWHAEPDECSRINACLDAGDRPQQIRYARPSCYHGAGVVVSFCDGRPYFLSEDIDYTVYQHLMTPDSAKAGVSGELKEEDY